jgi:hypothetical protein
MGFRVDPMLFVDGDEREVARQLLADYFSSYTGSRFEKYLDHEHPNEVTAQDLLAVSMLGVEIPADAAIWMLEDGRHEIGALLEQILPPTLAIWDEAADLGSGSPAWQLWDYIRNNRWPIGTGRSGLGRTKASKLLAAKRPHLFPVHDQHVAAALLDDPDEDFWAAWQGRLRGSAGEELRRAAEGLIMGLSAPPNLSVLRTLDIVVWMRVHGYKFSEKVNDLDSPTFLGQDG